MSGVGVADGAQRFVVASDEGRAGAHSRGSPADGQVQLEAELHHRISLVDFWMGEALAAQLVKGLPRSLHNGVVLFVTTGNVEQTEDHTARVSAQKAVEVAAYSVALDYAGNIGTRQRRKISGRRSGRRGCNRALAMERQLHRSVRIITEILQIANGEKLTGHDTIDGVRGGNSACASSASARFCGM